MFRGADIGNDHLLVVGRLRLKLRRVVKESTRRRLDLDKLKDPLTQREFSLKLENRFEVLVQMDAQEEETGLRISRNNIELRTKLLREAPMKTKETTSQKLHIGGFVFS